MSEYQKLLAYKYCVDKRNKHNTSIFTKPHKRVMVSNGMIMENVYWIFAEPIKYPLRDFIQNNNQPAINNYIWYDIKDKYKLDKSPTNNASK